MPLPSSQLKPELWFQPRQGAQWDAPNSSLQTTKPYFYPAPLSTASDPANPNVGYGIQLAYRNGSCFFAPNIRHLYDVRQFLLGLFDALFVAASIKNASLPAAQQPRTFLISRISKTEGGVHKRTYRIYIRLAAVGLEVLPESASVSEERREHWSTNEFPLRLNGQVYSSSVEFMLGGQNGTSLTFL